MRKLLIGLCFCLPMAVLAANSQYVSFHYNVISAGKTLTDEQCRAIFSSPVYYNIVENKPVYKQSKNASFEVLSYKRLQVAYISNLELLFTGQQKVKLNVNGKSVNTNLMMSFVYNKPQEMVRGSWIVPGYCKGNLVGLKQGLNHWVEPKTTINI